MMIGSELNECPKYNEAAQVMDKTSARSSNFTMFVFEFLGEAASTGRSTVELVRN